MNIVATIKLPDGQETRVIREIDNTVTISHESSAPNILHVRPEEGASVSVSQSGQNLVTVGSGVYQTVGQGNVWGNIGGIITNQTDLVQYISTAIDAIPAPATPTLQSVTDEGNTTTNAISAQSINLDAENSGGIYNSTYPDVNILPKNSAFEFNVRTSSNTGKLRISTDGSLYLASNANSLKLGRLHSGQYPKGQLELALNGSGYTAFFDRDGVNELMRVDGATGNVGIGTTAPAAELDVVGEINSTDLKVSNKIDTKKDEIEHWNINRDNYVFVQSIESNPTGIEFIDNGTRMLLCGYTTNRIHEYTMSTAWDLTTAAHTNSSQYLPQSGLSSTIEDFFISEDGTRIYALSRSSDSIGQFDLTTPFDITTMVFVRNVYYGYLDVDPTGIHFKPDGSVLYFCGYNTDNVFQVPLSTPWDISTAGAETFISVNEFGVSAVQYVEFNTDGTQMYIGGYNSDSLYRFDLSTAWDITTASLNSSSFSFRGNSETTTGLYYNDQEGKAFITGRSSDRVYELNINDGVYIGEAAVFEKDVKIDGEIESHSANRFFNINRFYSTLEAHSAFICYNTTRAAYVNGSGTFEVGNITYSSALSRFYKNNYGGADGVEAKVRFFENITGGRGRIEIGKDHTNSTWLVGGTTHVDSYANTFNHQGEFNLGGELKITGDKPIAYRDVNLRNLGSQVVFDDFTETADTYIDAHIPNVGAGYTLVYQSVGIIQDDIPVVSGGNGYLRTGRTNSNDGIMYINDTVINSDNYEVRATIREQHNSDDMFWLVIKYIDQDNYYAMSFSRDYGFCIPVSRVNGVDTVRGNLSYYANVSMDDLQSIDVAIRVTGDKVSVFYEGNYRGSFTDSGITQAGKGGFGFGAITPSVSTSYDIDDEWKISDFEIIEYPDSLFNGSNSVHYIENGNVGIGTTAPSEKLEVAGNIKSSEGLRLNYSSNTIGEIRGNANTYNNFDLVYGAAWDGSNWIDTLGAYESHKMTLGTGGIMFYTGSGQAGGYPVTYTERMRVANNGNVGIGTTSPTQKLDVNGDITLPLGDNLRWGSQLGIRKDSNGELNFFGGTNSTNGGFNFRGWNGSAYESGTLVIRNNGKVGIGTTAPTEKLHIVGELRVQTTTPANSAGTASIQLNPEAGTGAYIQAISNFGPTSATNYSAGLKFIVANRDASLPSPYYSIDALSILANGNVGIGTTTPSSKVHINGTAMEQLRMETQGGPAGTEDTKGNIGDMAYDANFFYIKTSNGWGRVPLDFAF